MIKPIPSCTITRDNKKYSITMTREPGFSDCNINIDDMKKRPVGGSSFRINRESKRIEKVAMAVTTNSDKSKGLGTVLHLGHVQSLVRNGLREISLMSFKDAVIFHAKFGYRADIQNPKDMACALSTVLKSTREELNGARKLAARLLENSPVKPVDESMQKTDYIKSLFRSYSDLFNKETSQAAEISPAEKRFIEQGNKILDTFLRRLIKSGLPREELHKQADFNIPFNMKLKKSLVFKNKAFYNELFRKYMMNFRLK